MPNNLNNWTYRDVIDVLKEYGFHLNHTRGSHHYFIGTVAKTLRQVCVPYHGSIAIKPRTMKGIMLQSGMSKEQWFQ